MIRRLAFTLVSIMVTWAGGVRLAEASCASASIHVSVAPIVWLSDVIPVAWHIDPACAVIETGLLLGRDPAALTPAGQPIYGPRTSYEQDLPVSEGGAYVVAAYVRDEAGNVVTSPPQVVVIDVPPVLPPDTHGSHGPLPFYTGTDADFLQPAGEPHYASLRSATLRNQRFVTDLFSEGFDSRLTAFTHPDEVRVQQQLPLEVGGVAFAVPPAEVDRALGDLDATFRSLGYPRSGLYLTSCGVFARFQPDQRVAGPACGFFSDSRPVSLAYGEARGSSGGQSIRSSATYFIPKPPAGKRVQSAKLRVFVFRQRSSTLSDIPLSGKLPVFADVTFCNFFICMGWATWDFTDEARALAAQGGGLLQLTLDPVPLVDGLASYGLSPDVNYPWRHGHENGALTLTFEADCPKELKLKVTPSVVRPIIPAFISGTGRLIRPAIKGQARVMPTEATVEATVKSCVAEGQTPQPVEVTFEIRPPAAGSTDAGGHLHRALPRPTGALQDLDRGQATDRCTVTTFTDGMGSCAITYRAGEISGVETIVARAEGFAEAQTTVTVQIPGLQNLATFNGGRLWRLTGDRPGLHTDNHRAQSNAISKTVSIATRVLEDYSASMGVNDISLVWGGMFDIRGDWDGSFHRTHRQGTGVDVDGCALSLIPNNPNPQSNDEKACPAGWVILPREDYFRRVCKEQGGRLAKEATIHCEFPQ